MKEDFFIEIRALTVVERSAMECAGGGLSASGLHNIYFISLIFSPSSFSRSLILLSRKKPSIQKHLTLPTDM